MNALGLEDESVRETSHSYWLYDGEEEIQKALQNFSSQVSQTLHAKTSDQSKKASYKQTLRLTWTLDLREHLTSFYFLHVVLSLLLMTLRITEKECLVAKEGEEDTTNTSKQMLFLSMNFHKGA